MKKNVMMRVASIMLVLVLMTSSVISGTFAKYTTQDDGKDKARVAKWGVALNVIGNLYGDSYDDKIVLKNDANVAVQAYNINTAAEPDDIVAPGTNNEEGFTFSLQGTPEVDGKIVLKVAYENIYLKAGTYGVMVPVLPGTVTEENFREFTGLFVENSGTYSPADTWANVPYYTLEDYVALGEDYYPVEYGMEGTGSVVNSYNETLALATTTNTLAELVNTFNTFAGFTVDSTSVVDGKTAYEYVAMNFQTNDDLQNIAKLGNQRIIWKWDFCQQGVCPDGDGACNYCKADTILGNLMADQKGESWNGKVVRQNVDGITYTAPQKASGTAENHYNLETEFSIDITVTQVD